MNIRRLVVCVVLLAFVGALSGCQTTYYSFWETFGKEKRHLLRDNVEDVRDSQEEAAEQFKDALTRIQEMYDFQGGDLEEVYRKLESDYRRSASRAEDVRSCIRDVEQIAGDLFEEWEEENAEIANRELRSRSMQQLRETQLRYERLHNSMKRAEESMDPVLQQLKDYVLYLKHNLNAQAVGALRGEADKIQTQVQSLVADMQRSIGEAQEFLKAFEPESP